MAQENLMDKKQKAIEELKKQRKLARERLGPEGVKELEKLAKGLNKPKASSTVPPGSVPYDKKAALAAFQMFLKNHGDPKEFERRLREMINKSSH
jgi:hypothetical protein